MSSASTGIAAVWLFVRANTTSGRGPIAIAIWSGFVRRSPIPTPGY